jgi:hypothetical protein
MSISRDELVKRLAEVSHLTYVRQKNRDHGIPLGEMTLHVTDHDRERAEDTVAELERLGIYREPLPGQPVDDAQPSEPPEPPPSQRKARREPVTDIWGNPITTRRKGR